MGWGEVVKEIGRCQVMMEPRLYPTGKMGLWVLCKEIMGQINYSGKYVEDGFKEGIRPSERPVRGVITVQKIIRDLK